MMARRRAAGARPLKRKVATRSPRKTLVVFCEGEKTEPQYLGALKRQPAVRDIAAVDLHVEIGQGGPVRRQLDGSDDKSLDGLTYMPLTADAARRAAQLDKRHLQNGTVFPDDNPSSGMHRLLTAIGLPNDRESARVT
jgi:hypothetical protein